MERPTAAPIGDVARLVLNRAQCAFKPRGFGEKYCGRTPGTAQNKAGAMKSSRNVPTHFMRAQVPVMCLVAQRDS